MQRKACTKCGIVKPLEDYHRDKLSRDGRKPRCKTCLAEQNRRYKEENREKIKERVRRYKEENREKVAEQKRRYYEENREKVAEYTRRYREENREQISEYARRYREENREEERERHRRYHQENRERLNERKRRYREENREVVKAKNLIRTNGYQSGTAVFAVNHLQPWALDEDEFIMEENGMTLYQKAIHIGRTYRSVKARREMLRRQ